MRGPGFEGEDVGFAVLFDKLATMAGFLSDGSVVRIEGRWGVLGRRVRRKKIGDEGREGKGGIPS